MKRRWSVCVDANFDDVEIEADRLWYAQDSGWLTFQNFDESIDAKGTKHIAAFAPGKWLYFREVTDEPR